MFNIATDNFVNKAIIFDWFRNVYTVTGTATSLNNSAICTTATNRLRVIRMTTTADIEVVGWPGSVVVIEHQPMDTCRCTFTAIEYPDPVQTKSNWLWDSTQTLWEKWWSVWVYSNAGIKLLMASS